VIRFLAAIGSQSDVTKSCTVDEFLILTIGGGEIPMLSFVDNLAHFVLPQYPAHTSTFMLVLQPSQHSLVNPMVQFLGIVFEADM